MLNDAQAIELAELSGQVLVFPDDSADSTFYCSSLIPRVACASGQQYQLALLSYVSVGTGPCAILALTIDLALAPATRQRLGALLQARCGKAPTILPIPWVSGSAAMGLLGGAPIDAQPALFGSNAVLFHKKLSDAEFLALQSRPANNLYVAYQLSFEVLRPQQDWTVTMDWQGFRKLVQEKCRLNLVFFDFSTATTLEEIETSGAIKVEGTDYAGNASFQASLGNRLRQLFTPVPAFVRADGEGEEEEGAWRIGYRCSELNDTQRLSSHTRFDFNVTAGERRPVFIQGLLPNLPAALKACDITYVRNDPNPLMQTVTFVCMADVERDQIQLIRVTLKNKRGGNKELVFRPGALAPQSIQASFLADNVHFDSWEYEVIFSDTSGRASLLSGERPFSAESPKYVIARELYSRQDITLSVAPHLWDIVDQCLIEVKTEQGAKTSLFELSQAQPVRIWECFCSPPDVARFSYQLRFQAPNRSLSFDWQAGDERICADLKRGTIEFVVSDEVRRQYAGVQVKLSQAEVLLSCGQFDFDADWRDVEIDFLAADDLPRTLRYQATFTPLDGSKKQPGIRKSEDIRASSGNTILIVAPPLSPP